MTLTLRPRDDTLHPMLSAALVGLAGALAVTAVHQAAKAAIPSTAPRMDVLGRRAIAKGIRAAGGHPPDEDRLQAMALVGELVSNGLYYALVATNGGRSAWLKGTLLGSSAGIGAVVLPPYLGLGSAPSGRTPQTKVMAFLWYLLGGLAAAGVAEMLKSDRKDRWSPAGRHRTY